METSSGDTRVVMYEVKAPAKDDTESFERESTRDPDDVEETPAASKTRIVWNVDIDTAMREGWQAQAARAAQAAPASQAQPAQAVRERTMDEDEWSELTGTGQESDGTEESFPSDLEPTPRGSLLVYPTGCRIEYYSKTFGRWLAGRITGMGELSRLSRLPTYQVTVGIGARKQLRPNVELDLLRLPFKLGDVVSVYDTKAQKWLPGIVKEEQTSEASFTPMYSVAFAQREGLAATASVLATNIRAEYPAGSSVEVYYSDMGWVSGVVVDAPRVAAAVNHETKWVEVHAQLLDEMQSRQVRVPSYRVRFEDECNVISV